MRSIILSTLLALSVVSAPQASAQSLSDILGGIFEPTSPEQSKTTRDLSGLSQFEVEAGFKEALTLGARAVGAQLSQENGYFGDSRIQIPLPGQLGEVQSQLSRFGMSGPLDDLQLRLNRAAEDAAPEAADLVVQAVQSVTINDALALLQGGDTAATEFLRSKTEGNLQELFRPYMQSALTGSGALDQVDQVSSNYGLSQYTDDLEDQMIDGAVSEGLDGLFYYLAEEERDIRKNPVKRSTDLLRRVFGG